MGGDDGHYEVRALTDVGRVVVLCGAGALYIALLFSGALRRKYRGGPHYFLSFGIILTPMRLCDPISETEAQVREKEGTVYYIGHFDGSGKPLMVEKRRNGKTNFKFTYSYEKRRLVKCTYINYKTGWSVCKQRTPTGSFVSVAAPGEQ